MKGLARIRALLPQLSPADNKIARYLLEYPQQVKQFSSPELARAIGVSQSTIVKFSQKIGYSGFSDLKVRLYESELAYQPSSKKAIHGTISRSDNMTLVMAKLLSSKQQSLDRTVALNDEQTIQRAAGYLHLAGKIQIAGVGASSLVAKDLSYKLTKIGHAVHCEYDTHIQVANAAALSENDVLVALSYSGRSREVLSIAQLARSKGAKVIIISQLAPTPLDKYADIKLMTAADEEQIRSSSITARDSQLLMTDLLFIAVTQQEESADQLIEQSKSAVAALKQ
ncbi:MurR/RpiR family transcriptional regulator [Vibrio sp. Isolate25]|uniref:MurR/RpiR family transcriptional regulator n=1 Tax=Vibrio TaxID=662 RepID=UPI001EFE3596|nr:MULTISPECIES: MurR/RpiR family transcriptional regulator [Vibrio]MCG9598387.1 MurR/RpiR family transcriptional regulator [Vibrio sp. Isolate25]MCG9679954.1 MurR/RpiR family transcriptional regulator [Vibrio sp. Isolate24]MCG9684469.1 MurR/RpiR family transcriptional regulator [Vibrio sp. Isolate23]USD33019.1 MurR/RpiR family transcriptional regulator [Vibrio sp. SCSIO 43186]USD46087.1 MurR/RpiR family transcriptional regulator [Vibrio sp. SCSIO 43145]